MTFRIVALAGLAISALAQTPPCATIEGDQIRGSDLARALPVFQHIPADTPLAPAPLPGGSRIFTTGELETLAARFSIAADALPETCFRVLTEPLARDHVLAAMQASFPGPGVQIELLDVSTEKVPHGRIEFPPEGLGTPALADRKTPVLWRGAVIYGADGRRFPIWARVTITAPITRVIALENLKSGVPIQANQLRREIVESFPIQKPPVDMDQVAGMLPLHSISAGAEVRRENIAPPIEVHRGDRVRVEVRIGAAHLAMSGRAEASGRVGDSIVVLNPDSSKTFHARVEGQDRVVVELASFGGE